MMMVSPSLSCQAPCRQLLGSHCLNLTLGLHLSEEGSGGDGDDGADPFQDLTKLDFFITGASVSTVEGDLVCAAWLVPPHDAEEVVCVMDKVDRCVSIDGLHVQYEQPALRFNPSAGTPAAVKMIYGKPHLMLMRAPL